MDDTNNPNGVSGWEPEGTPEHTNEADSAQSAPQQPSGPAKESGSGGQPFSNWGSYQGSNPGPEHAADGLPAIEVFVGNMVRGVLEVVAGVHDPEHLLFHQ